MNEDLGYPIYIGDGLAGELAEFARRRGPIALVLCDANRHVAAFAKKMARAAGAPVKAFPLGESRKRLATVERVSDAMLGAGVERSGLVLGVGGGVASDLFGFACATYMRGVQYAHVA
ncbi:MAG TPA: 3-dehydroquinate synthase, partial [Candidatus Nitrosotalea sp.]|nr:3-dehydroquinate synthase [Candidatus Nitrosotalea sp.]